MEDEDRMIPGLNTPLASESPVKMVILDGGLGGTGRP